MSFETAYSLASRIREDLNDSEPGHHACPDRRSSSSACARSGNREEATTYSRLRRPGGRVMVEEADGRLVPFSRARHERRLACCGLCVDEAGAVTQLLYRHLLATGPNPIPGRPGRRHHPRLRPSRRSARKPRTAISCGRTSRAADGRSSCCSAAPPDAARAPPPPCSRTDSTSCAPSRRTCSARSCGSWSRSVCCPCCTGRRSTPGRRCRGTAGAASCTDAALADGFRAQAELLSRGERGGRASRAARTGLVRAGGRPRQSRLRREHLPRPGRRDRDHHARGAQAEAAAAVHPGSRSRQSPHRRAERYLENFDDIWRLQAHLLDQADQAGIPIIENNDREEVFRRIMLHVIDRLSVGFAATPARGLRRDRFFRAHRMQSA